MKFGEQQQIELDAIDHGILAVLQDDCRTPLARIGEHVGLTASSVLERVKKLEEGGVIRGYHAALDARRLGLDVTAFIGVSTNHPRGIAQFEEEVDKVGGILECHHVTGGYTMLLKVKTASTSTLERLISRLRSIEGVEKTETMVVLSTHTETTRLHFGEEPAEAPAKGHRRSRKNGDRPRLQTIGGQR